jgi:hypothetical protein
MVVYLGADGKVTGERTLHDEPLPVILPVHYKPTHRREHCRRSHDKPLAAGPPGYAEPQEAVTLHAYGLSGYIASSTPRM